MFIPGIFKRHYEATRLMGSLTSPGPMFFVSTDHRSIPARAALVRDVGLELRKGMIVIQEAGQLGGLIGRSVLIGEHVTVRLLKQHVVTARNDADTGYLFAILASTYGVRLISREAAGSSIPPH